MVKKSRNQELINEIAQHLALLRNARKYSQEEVYNELGIHIGRIETGKLNISISTLEEILSFYKVPLSDFFKDIEK